MRPAAPRRDQVPERQGQGVRARQPEHRRHPHQGAGCRAGRQRRRCQGCHRQGIRPDGSLRSEHPAEGPQVRRPDGSDGQQLQEGHHGSRQDRPALRHQLVGRDEEEREERQPRRIQGERGQEPHERPRHAEHRREGLRFARRSGEVQRHAFEEAQRIG